MNENVKNIKTSVGDLVGSATGLVALTCKGVAGIAKLTRSTIEAAPECGKQGLFLPFHAATRYNMEQGMERQAAHAKAFKYVEQPLADTIVQIGEGTGALVAELLKDELKEPTHKEESK